MAPSAHSTTIDYGIFRVRSLWISGLRKTEAVANDVHVVAMSCPAAGHNTLLPTLIAEGEKPGREDIMVVCGGVIPARDYDFLYQNGAAAIFGPGTVIPDSARRIPRLLLEQPGD